MTNVVSKFPTVGNLDISAKTPFLLAQNSTPESARQEAIEKETGKSENPLRIRLSEIRTQKSKNSAENQARLWR